MAFTRLGQSGGSRRDWARPFSDKTEEVTGNPFLDSLPVALTFPKPAAVMIFRRGVRAPNQEPDGIPLRVK